MLRSLSDREALDQLIDLNAVCTIGSLDAALALNGAAERRSTVAEAHVQVGLESHPMSHKHHIRWILLETDRGVAIRFLPPEGEPAATFPLAEEEVLTAVYADCNLHGLWETPL